ncbi:OmpA family protein [Georgenia sp. H159]|uniref:OmpA family protein n=1 Tax=Georgenia sp. H159 TaxID=3076115 RepID=UPI002D76FC50|nr:OmpA family protein [Georgenia sp. H159]
MAKVWAALAVVATLLLSTSSAAQTDTSDTEPLTDTPLPVVGAVAAQSAWGGKLSRFDEVLHGVWRTDGGTIAYWSVRHRPSEGDESSLTSTAHKLRGGSANLTTPPGFTETSLAARETGELYPVLLDETTETCLCTNVTEMGLNDGVAEEVSDGWQLVYAVFPELPAEVTSVDVHVDGFGAILPDVPVQDGPLPTPQVSADHWVASGQGWPAPPSAEEIARAAEARTLGAVWVLAERSGSADGSWAQRESGDVREIDLAADVLFAPNEYAIDDDAGAVLDDVAAQIEGAQVTRAAIVGHTDGDGTEEHNETLSENRARSVESALAERLPEVAFSVEGRGWHEPIASNQTDEGKALNRRVTITLEGVADAEVGS